ncbi:MAG: restriction endonuclease [Chloroflexi bacterium]|nr:MAG: restriction endonuclease [Chloroflexota bacterium]PIE81320.1 MAG: restriction endonuclease [Chloroflexota bacterium]
MPAHPQIFELTEYQPTYFSPEQLPASVFTYLYHNFDQNGGKVEVQFPSPRTNGRYRLTPQGWVGWIPISPTLHLSLLPKVNLSNLFRMWQTAYRLPDIFWQDSWVQVKSLREFYERLAAIFAKMVLHRSRLGFRQAYLPQTTPLPYIRGRITKLPQPPQTAVTCHHHRHTPDLPHNQILAYTLDQILRARHCQENTQTILRRAYHTLHGLVTYTEFDSSACHSSVYTRLNQDYRSLHALCRFFLENTGPSHKSGDHTIQPFLINMALLFEQFVAEWITQHLPNAWQLKTQEIVHFGTERQLQFKIDMVLYDKNGRCHTILDTKYKTPTKPSPADINQIIAYAKSKACHNAILIYPQPLPQPLDIWLDDLHLRSLSFPLHSDLDTAGKQLLQKTLLTN